MTAGYLLDSHVLLWALLDTDRLSKQARSVLQDDGVDVYVSGVSFYELMFKARRGHLPAIVMSLPGLVSQGNYLRLAISEQHLQIATLLDWRHGDPFDRLLLAQAEREDLRLLSVDKVFDELGDRRVWDGG